MVFGVFSPGRTHCIAPKKLPDKAMSIWNLHKKFQLSSAMGLRDFDLQSQPTLMGGEPINCRALVNGMELNGSHFPTARLMKRPYQRPYTTHFIPNSLETHWMKDDTTAKPMIPASSRVSADLNRVPESCYPT